MIPLLHENWCHSFCLSIIFSFCINNSGWKTKPTPPWSHPKGKAHGRHPQCSTPSTPYNVHELYSYSSGSINRPQGRTCRQDLSLPSQSTLRHEAEHLQCSPPHGIKAKWPFVELCLIESIHLISFAFLPHFITTLSDFCWKHSSNKSGLLHFSS